MSDRSAVALDDKTVQLLRELGDRITALEKRQVQGDIAIDSLTVGSLTVKASSTTPVVLAGAQRWTQAVEFMGTYSPLAGDDAVVIRDELGGIRDMFPRQYAQLGAAPAQNITSSTPTVLTLTGAVASSSPYPASKATAAGQLIIPVTGIYLLLQAGVWGALADATVRLVAIEASTNGGASWATLFAVDQSNLNNAGFGQLQEVIGVAPLTVGTRLRVNVDQRSATSPLAYVPQVFSATFLRGPV